MSRYRLATISDAWGDAHTADCCFEQDKDTFTGLYHPKGHRIHRVAEPIGFDPNRWNDTTMKMKKRKGKGRGC